MLIFVVGCLGEIRQIVVVGKKGNEMTEKHFWAVFGGHFVQYCG
jgi:hypothetical protein